MEQEKNDACPFIGLLGGCDEEERGCPKWGSLAMVSIPRQEFGNLYEPEKGLRRGTVFAELDMPFYGDGRDVK